MLNPTILYEDIRFDEQSQNGYLIFPSRRRLRDYKSYILPQREFNPGVINKLDEMLKSYSEQKQFSVILLDEMKIQEDLVWDKRTGNLIGYIYLSDKELNFAMLKKVDDVFCITHSYLVREKYCRSIVALANFATKNIKSYQLFPMESNENT